MTARMPLLQMLSYARGRPLKPMSTYILPEITKTFGGQSIEGKPAFSCEPPDFSTDPMAAVPKRPFLRFPCHNCFHMLRCHFWGPVIIIYIKNNNGNITSTFHHVLYGLQRSFFCIISQYSSKSPISCPLLQKRKQTQKKEGACSSC